MNWAWSSAGRISLLRALITTRFCGVMAMPTTLGVVEPCQNSTASALDSSGDTVVGGLAVCTDNPDDINYESAFVWKKGNGMADLNDLLTQPSDLHLEFATGINDRGEITA